MTAVAVEAPLDVAAVWRRLRFPLVIGVLAIAAVAGLAAIGSGGSNRALDPTSAAPSGARALAALLREREISSSTTTAEHLSAGGTVVVLDPAVESDDELSRVSTAASTVLLVDPGSRELHRFGIAADPDDRSFGDTLAPNCPLPAAGVAGPVHISGDLYNVPTGTTGCYRNGGDAALLARDLPGGGHVYAMGSASTFDNEHLAKQGDAALGLALLTSAPTSSVQWVFPSPLTDHATGPRRGLVALLPSRLEWAVLQLFLAVVVLALWRGRRLGRPVVEPLPVVVRAAETVEGRARLLRAAAARGAAATSLRTASRGRLAGLLRVGDEPDPQSVVTLAAQRSGRPSAEVHAVLYGPDPSDDAGLTRLAQQLSALEAEVRAPHEGGNR